MVVFLDRHVLFSGYFPKLVPGRFFSVEVDHIIHRYC